MKKEANSIEKGLVLKKWLVFEQIPIPSVGYEDQSSSSESYQEAHL